MKETDQLSNSINKPTSYFYKKRKIIYINEYGYKEVRELGLRDQNQKKGLFISI